MAMELTANLDGLICITLSRRDMRGLLQQMERPDGTFEVPQILGGCDTPRGPLQLVVTVLDDDVVGARLIPRPA
jgi:hypothetical protein